MNNQKGFVSLGVLLALITGVAVLGGGTYYVMQQAASPQMPEYQVQVNTLPVAQEKAQVPINANSQRTPTIQPTGQTVGVSGMSKYTDVDFGFSFWYPSGWTVTNMSETGDGMFAGTTDIAGNVSAGRIIVRGNGREINIDKVTSADLSYRVLAGACGSCDPITYYFDTAQHVWMSSIAPGKNIAPASEGQVADISNNTMGGLHVFYGQGRQLNRIVPLSARKFLSVSDTAGWTGTSGEESKIVSLTKTIVATDPSVATPVSIAEQNTIIQAEAAAFLQ